MSDLRMPLIGVAAWVGALLGLLAPAGVVLTLLVAGFVVLGVAWRRSVSRRVDLDPDRPPRSGTPSGATRHLTIVTTLMLTCAAVAGVAMLHGVSISRGPVADLAIQRAVTKLELTVTSDPRAVQTAYDDVVVVRGTVTRIEGRGRAHRVSTKVVVLGDATWQDVALGSRVMFSARLGPAEGDVAALVSPNGTPEVIESPDVWWRAASVVRASIREAVDPRAPDAANLVPALVVGDDAGMDPALSDDFQVTGLTHLLAVSGTNLTLLIGALLLAARWLGVRGRWTYVIATLGILGFIVLARTEPSVVRAAAMGTVALVALGSNGRERGSRCLAVAVFGLLLWDPELARTAGFALSVLATGGILMLAPMWRDAMTWAPRWVADALSVPLAAQVACTPVVTALAGQVSLVAVVANLIVAPAVAPVTVLGLAGGIIGLVWMPLGQLVAAPGAWAASWIVTVARQGGALPTPAVGWGTDPWSLVGITVLSLTALWWMPRLLARPVLAVGSCVLLVVVIVSRPPTPGWPAHDWLVASCDVGQGDAVVLRAGPRSGVVIDAGPDPVLIDGCLDRLGVEAVPLLVLTHFHADHIDGLPGVMDGRSVGDIWTSPLADPPSGVEQVTESLSARGLAMQSPLTGAPVRVGDVELTPVWPPPGYDSSGEPNDASVVVRAEVGGLSILLTGDIGPEGQLGLARSLGEDEVDILKVPHHGSRYQDLDFLAGLDARLALVSVGRGNDYGHPSADVLAGLQRAGVTARRTDIDGDLLVVLRDGEIQVAARGDPTTTNE